MADGGDRIRAAVLSSGGARGGVVFLYTPGYSSAGPTFTRATVADYTNSSQLVAQAGSGVIRDAHYAYASTLAQYYKSTLLEGAATELLIRNEALNNAAWSKNNSPVLTDGFATNGVLSLTRYQGTPGTDYISQGVTLTGDGVKALAIYVQANGVNGTGNFKIRDTTAPADRGTITWTITGSVVTAVASVGTLLLSEPLGAGLYRFWLQTTSCTAANTHVVFINGNAGTSTDCIVAGPSCRNAAFPSSHISTGPASVTRNADVLTEPFSLPPQAMTVYCRIVQGDGVPSGTVYPIMISDNAVSAAYFAIGAQTNGSYFTQYSNGGSASTSGLVGTGSVVMGDLIELRATMDGTAVARMGLTRNAGTETNSTAGSSVAFAAYPTPTLLSIHSYNSGAVGVYFGAYTHVAVLTGVRSLAECRALAGVSSTGL